jgi:hypothetical protein
MAKTRDDVMAWLHRLDAYTNAEFGSARTLSAICDACVACGANTTSPDANGLCRRCSIKRTPDYDEIRLFRPTTRSPRSSS